MDVVVRIPGLLRNVVGKNVKVHLYDDEMIIMGGSGISVGMCRVESVDGMTMVVTPLKKKDAVPLEIAITSIRRIEYIEEGDA